MIRHTIRDSRETFSQVQGPVFMKRPSPAAIDALCHPRLPARYLQAGLKMNKMICWQAQRRIRDLALRHIDFSIPYLRQPQSQIDFFKREVLLDVELSHLTWYEDGWIVEVFLRILYHRPRIMRGLQQLDFELRVAQDVPPSTVFSDSQATQPEDAQHDSPRHRSSTVCSDSQATQPEDAQHDNPRHTSSTVCSDSQATQPEDAQDVPPSTVFSDSQATIKPEDTQHDSPRHMPSTVCSDSQAAQPEDAQDVPPSAVYSDSQATQPEDAQLDHPRQTSLTVRSDYQATQPKDAQVNTVQDGDARYASSRLELLSTLLASMPSLYHCYADIVQAGLSTEEHLFQFFRMSSVWRERFITQALTETSTLFERVVIMEILEELRNGALVGTHITP